MAVSPPKYLNGKENTAAAMIMKNTIADRFAVVRTRSLNNGQVSRPLSNTSSRPPAAPIAPDWDATQTPEFDEDAAHHYGMAISGSSPTITVPIDASLLTPGGDSDTGLFVELRLVNSATGHHYPSRMLAVSSAVLDDRSWLWSSFAGGRGTRPVQGGRPTKQVGSIRITDFPIRPPSGKRPKPGPKTSPPR